MHAFEFLQRYGPTAIVTEVTDTPGEEFAAELAKGGFDLLLPCADPDELAPLKARLEDHEGVEVDLYPANIEDLRFPETLFADTEQYDIGLLVCGIEPGHPRMAGSLISSLTRTFIPRLRARRHSGVIIVDVTGKAQRLGDTLAHELRPEGIDVLTLSAAAAPGTAPETQDLAKLALDHMEHGEVLSFSAQVPGTQD
jgi:short-subunit dehydrogenase